MRFKNSDDICNYFIRTIGAFIEDVATGAPAVTAVRLESPNFAAANDAGYIPYDVYKMRMFRRWYGYVLLSSGCAIQYTILSSVCYSICADVGDCPQFRRCHTLKVHAAHDD